MPCLEAVYAAPAALPRRPASEAVLTITPLPAASMCGSTARVSRKGAVRLTRMTRSHSASLTSASADIRSMIPALLTSTSTPPKRSTAVATTASTTDCSLRSPVTATAMPPASLISSTTARTPSALRSAATTRSPWAAKVSAVARPMPEPAPVTMTPRPSSPSAMNRSSHVCQGRVPWVAHSSDLMSVSDIKSVAEVTVRSRV